MHWLNKKGTAHVGRRTPVGHRLWGSDAQRDPETSQEGGVILSPMKVTRVLWQRLDDLTGDWSHIVGLPMEFLSPQHSGGTTNHFGDVFGDANWISARLLPFFGTT